MAFDFAREWPFFPDDEKLRVFEPRANVAILIGHTEVEIGGATKADPPLAVILDRLAPDVPRDRIAAVGTIATLRDGVERVVQNLLTNPYITVLVLCGEDSPVFYPLEGIHCLFRHGVDEGRHVLPGNGATGRAAKVFARDALATLSHEEIALFRSRPLAIVDRRGSTDPAVFLPTIAAELPSLVRPVDSPSWGYLAAIDVYRWRPRILQVPAGTLEPLSDLEFAWSEGHVWIAPSDGPGVVAGGKPDGRAQRALHTALRRGFVDRGEGWESRLARLAFGTERAVLTSGFPTDAVRIGGFADVGQGPFKDGAEVARPSPIELDPKGFFKIRVGYEQGVLSADYHEAAGRHVETLQARDGEHLLAAIVGGDYLGPSPAREQHLVYLGVQIARADFALRTGLAFEEGQGLSDEARKNVDHHLHAGAVVAGRSLEDSWVRGLAGLREQGLLTHTQKGRVAEGWCTFFVIPDMGAMTIPGAYAATDEHIAHYADELLAAAPEVRARGDYTYGDRTCHFFGVDQVTESGRRLAADPDTLRIHQRWAPEVDLPATAHHRPCLVFDCWFRHGGRLHTLQIARSHDVFGGLPQNALGIARGWGGALTEASGIPLGDLCFLSISNNFRVGDDVENVRKAIQSGVHAAPLMGTLPLPDVRRGDEGDVAAALGEGDAPLAALVVPQLTDHAVGTAAAVLAAAPAPLAERLLAYRGNLDQVATAVARLRAETERGGRERTNSVLLSPRDPRVDREAEATPLVCLQLRRQLGRLHGAAVVVGTTGVALVPVLFELQRVIARTAGLPVGSGTVVRVG